MVSERVEVSDSSTSDEEIMTPVSNGISKVKLATKEVNGDVNDNGAVNGEAKEKLNEEPVAVGMQCGLKNLYSGKEDKVS